MKLNQKLKKYRLKAKLTQEEAAAKIFVTRTTISKYESGALTPSEEIIENLAKIYNIPKSKLINKDKNIPIFIVLDSLVNIIFLTLYFIPMFHQNKAIIIDNRIIGTYITYSAYQNIVNSYPFLLIPFLLAILSSAFLIFTIIKWKNKKNIIKISYISLGAIFAIYLLVFLLGAFLQVSNI